MMLYNCDSINVSEQQILSHFIAYIPLLNKINKHFSSNYGKKLHQY